MSGSEEKKRLGSCSLTLSRDGHRYIKGYKKVPTEIFLTQIVRKDIKRNCTVNYRKITKLNYYLCCLLVGVLIWRLSKAKVLIDTYVYTRVILKLASKTV